MKYHFYIEITMTDGETLKCTLHDSMYSHEFRGTVDDACDRGLDEVMKMDYLLISGPKGRRSINLQYAKYVDIWAEEVAEDEE